MDEPRRGNSTDGAREVLIAEFEQLSAAFLQNEQSGEVRLNLFLLVVGGGLTALGLSERGAASLITRDGRAFGVLALFLVLAFGWFTLVRLVHRNRVTDDYLRRLGRVRCAFLRLHPELAGALPFPASTDQQGRRLEWRHLLVPERAGLVELTCFLNAALAGGVAGLACLLVFPDSWAIAVYPAGAGALVAWVLEFCFVRYRYEQPLSPCGDGGQT